MNNKKICKNCGKELTKSATKCKYCNTPCYSPKKQIIKFIKVILVIFIIFFIYKLTTNPTNFDINSISIIQNPLSQYIIAFFLILMIIGAFLGNVLCSALLLVLLAIAAIQWLYQYWIPISVIGGLIFLTILGDLPNKNIEEKITNTKDNQQNSTDYRKGNCYGMSKEYAIVIYKSDNPEWTEKLFYEFKVWAPHIKNAPKSIFVKGKNKYNVYTATYLEYKIISESEYLNISIPDGVGGYSYYS